jgi:putative transcriptional regulator
VTKLGARLIKSANEAVAIAEGKKKPARLISVEEIDVAAIRSKMKLSQGKFAERFHLSAATVRDWEQKRRNPDRIATNLLRVIEYSPETVERALEREMNVFAIKPQLNPPMKRAPKRASEPTKKVERAR